MSGSLRFEESDVTKVPGPIVIAHVTNNRGGWGRGFVLALEKEFPSIGAHWKGLKQVLGRVDCDAFGPMHSVRIVAHLCAQDGYASRERPCVLDYDALRTALTRLQRKHHAAATTVAKTNYTIHMPRIGCGLAGGEWSKVEAIIRETLVDNGIDVVVHDWPPKQKEEV